MTLYRCVPLYSAGQIVGIVQQHGTLDGEVVVLPDGNVSEPEGWHPTPSQAWEACGESIDATAETLLRQADGCRTRATEEACS